MSPTYKRTIATLLALAPLSAAACSALPFADRTEAFEFIAGTSESALCQDGDDTWFLDETADLVGPHFAVSVMCHFEGAEIPEALAVGDLADLSEAADGVDFLVTQFAFGPEYTAESQLNPDDAHTVDSGPLGLKAWIEAGEERFDLEQVPAGGDLLAVTVPADAEAVLWIEEDGRAQGLNLGTGAQVDPVPAYYDGRSLEPSLGDAFEYYDVEVANGDKAWRLTCGSNFVQDDRAAWRVAEGWAEPGTVFLEIQLNWCTYDEGIRWNLAEEGSLRVTVGDEEFAPISWNAADLEDADAVRYTAVFAIPEDATDATLIFTPVGNLENLDGGEDYAFVDTPASTERDLEL